MMKAYEMELPMVPEPNVFVSKKTAPPMKPLEKVLVTSQTVLPVGDLGESIKDPINLPKLEIPTVSLVLPSTDWHQIA